MDPPSTGETTGVGCTATWAVEADSGTWNITSLGGKEPELVRVVERYQLQLSAAVLEFTPVDESVASLCLKAWGNTLTVVCAYTPNRISVYVAFLEVLAGVLAGVLHGAPVGDSVVLLGDVNDRFCDCIS